MVEDPLPIRHNGFYYEYIYSRGLYVEDGMKQFALYLDLVEPPKRTRHLTLFAAEEVPNELRQIRANGGPLGQDFQDVRSVARGPRWAKTGTITSFCSSVQFHSYTDEHNRVPTVSESIHE